MKRNVRRLRVANPTNVDNLDFKSIGRGIVRGFGNVLKVGGSVANRPGITNLGTKIVDRTNADKAKAQIKSAAAVIPPRVISKGKELLQSGIGTLSPEQQEFAKGQTDPSRLPKTADLKEAEQKIMLPQTPTPAMADDTIMGIDKKLVIGGGIVLVIIVIAVVLTRK